jgi:hypothetical protein
MYCFQRNIFGAKFHLQNTLFFPILCEQEYE